jgi:hypothetical protein
MEGLVVIVLVFGAGVLVAALVARDLWNFPLRCASVWRWFLIVLLSIYQVGCWRMMADFGAAFGNSNQLQPVELSFYALLLFWLVVQLVCQYVNRRRRAADSQGDASSPDSGESSNAPD